MREPGDDMLVQIAGRDDTGTLRAERVQLRPGGPGREAEVTAVETDRAEPRAGHLERGRDRCGNVIGVHEQRRVDAECGDLGCERQAFGRMDEGERVRRRSRGRDVPPPARFQVGCGGEPDQVGGSGGGDGSLLVGTA